MPEFALGETTTGISFRCGITHQAIAKMKGMKVKRSKWFPMNYPPQLSGKYEIRVEGVPRWSLVYFYAGTPWRIIDVIRLSIWQYYADAGGEWRGLEREPK